MSNLAAAVLHLQIVTLAQATIIGFVLAALYSQMEMNQTGIQDEIGGPACLRGTCAHAGDAPPGHCLELAGQFSSTHLMWASRLGPLPRAQLALPMLC